MHLLLVLNLALPQFGRVWSRPSVSWPLSLPWRDLCARAQAGQAGVTSLQVTRPSLLPLWLAEVRSADRFPHGSTEVHKQVPQ